MIGRGVGFLAGMYLAARGVAWVLDAGGPRICAWWQSRY